MVGSIALASAIMLVIILPNGLGELLSNDVLVCILFAMLVASPIGVISFVFCFGGIGLLGGRTWGYYLHLIASAIPVLVFVLLFFFIKSIVLPFWTTLSIAYLLVTFLISLSPYFKKAAFNKV